MQIYSQMPDDGALVFLHNFRCAGNATTFILSEVFGPDMIFRYGKVDDRVFDFDDFKAASRDDRHRLYLGHFCFGVHRHIPRPVEYLVNIRNPVDRVASHYSVACATQSCTFDEWQQSEFDACNGMVKRLCGFGYVEGETTPYDFVNDRPLPRDFEVDESHYAQALDNVRTWSMHVIVQDLLVGSLCLLQRHLRCRPLFSLSRQHFNQFPRVPEIERHAERIEELNALDSRLYAELRSCVAKRIAAQDPDFQEDVLALALIDRVASKSQCHVLGFDEFLERLGVALSTLFRDGHHSLIAKVLTLILTKPNIPPAFWIKAVRLMEILGHESSAATFRDAYEQRFGTRFPG